MSSHRARPVIPRDGNTLVVGVVARISGCQNQKELSLDDQRDHAVEIVIEEYGDILAEYRVIATKGKGESLDRPELAEIEAMIRTRELDVLVAEDIGRMVRGTEAARLCGLAVDAGTRVLAPNDCIDTLDDSWEEDVIAACRDHVGHNSHTSKRIKHKKMNRFKKFGGATPCETYGYIKSAGAKTFDDWIRDPLAEGNYGEWLRILQQTLNASAVADFLNDRAVPTGKFMRRKTWNGAMVRRITRNPLLKGMPGRGFMHTIKHHETGRRISVKNPDGPVFRDYPHLAFWEPAEFDDINARLDAANKGCGRKPINGVDPLTRVPRTRTRFPGQHARCWYCGRQSVWGGNGVTENLMCNGAREWKCWNSIGFSGAAAAAQTAEAIFAELARLDGIDAQFRDLVEQASQEGGGELARESAELTRAEVETARRKENVLAGLAEYGPIPMIKAKLAEIEVDERALAGRRHRLERLRGRAPQLPGSVVELRTLFEAKFRGLAHDSPEFGNLLRLVVPEFHVYLVRLCDGGHLLPRARVRLDLSGIIPDARHAPALETMLSRTLDLNLFEPPQRERIRADAVRLAAEGMDQREIARRLPEKVTQPAVTNALALDRLMRQRGLDTPYEVVTAPPDDYLKLRRHQNPKYRFEPEEGFQQPPI